MRGNNLSCAKGTIRFQEAVLLLHTSPPVLTLPLLGRSLAGTAGSPGVPILAPEGIGVQWPWMEF